MTKGESKIPALSAPKKLSWKDTAREIAVSGEDWSDWEATAGDGLGAIPWEEQVSAPERRKQED